MTELEQRILSVSDDREFEALALEVFRFQYAHVPVYKAYVDVLGRKEPKTIKEIPFLPISFFKTHRIIADGLEPEVLFKSSGTGGSRSTHYVAKKELYEQTFLKIYTNLMGAPKDQVILALLPNYLEQGDSSLVYMVDYLIQKTGSELSGFFLENHDDLLEHYSKAIAQGKQVVIFGVSYALLDLCEKQPDLSHATIIETGGMKGRRKELTKKELHTVLRSGLQCEHISSEYGMTELLSQAYSKEGGIFYTGNTMRILIREVNDPFSFQEHNKTGGINIIDLSNLYSCSFIETQDLGKQTATGFEIMGRFDHSDIRGCNLLVQ